MQNSLDVRKGSIKAWVLASRPKTLIAGASPVLVAASIAGWVRLDLFFLCLFFSLFIQIGANLANDYFDYIKGADTADRMGPPRAAQSGWISLPQLKIGMNLVFVFAFLISLPLLMRGGHLGFPIVAASILFAIAYTAGPYPLGYLGLGEFFVLLFYGPVAVLSTYYILTLSISPEIFWLSLSPGLLSCSILIANNLRDEKSDKTANKRTLVVRFGRRFGQLEYTAAVLGAALIPIALALLNAAPKNWLAMGLFFPFAFQAAKKCFQAKMPETFADLLPFSAKLLGIYTLLFIGMNFL